MKRARTEERERGGITRESNSIEPKCTHEKVAQLLLLNVKARWHLCKLRVCMCGSAKERRWNAKHVWMKKGEKHKWDKGGREDGSTQWWMRLIEFEIVFFYGSSADSFSSPNHFVLSFCDGCPVSFISFSLFAPTLIPTNIIRYSRIPDRIPKHLLHRKFSECIVSNDLKEFSHQPLIKP